MKAALLAPGDDRWMQVLRDTPHEFYHWPDYVRLEASRMAGEPIGLLVEGNGAHFFLPLVVRPVGKGSGALDAISPYGYPGPLVVARNRDSAEFAAEAIAAALPILRDAGWVTVFVRMSPLLNRAEDFSRSGTLVEHGDSVWIDLTLTPEELQKQVRSRFRSYINGAQRAGLTARFDDEWSSLDDFVRLYHQTMRKVGAADWYFFQRPYFEGLRRLLGSDIKLCLVEFEGRIIAAGLYAVSGGIVQYLLSGTDETAEQPHATKLMMIFVRDWAREAGHRVLHLGGGLGGGADDLLTFKRGFSKVSSRFYSWRWIVDQGRYRTLIEEWERAHGVSAEGTEGYFPGYRKTVIAPSRSE
jgi:hypothetical protein